MILISQSNSESNTKLIQDIFNNKLESTIIKIDRDKVKKDVEHLKAESTMTKNRLNSKNIDIVIRELNRLLKLSDNDESAVEIAWGVKDSTAESYPFNMVNDRTYGVDSVEYFKLKENEHIIELDFTELSDIITFEFIYEELGETIESVNSFTEHAGMGRNLNESSILTSNFEDDMLELSKIFQIDNSPYIDGDKETINDYFGLKKFKLASHAKNVNDTSSIKSYRDVIKYSCKHALSIIAANIINKALNANMHISLLGISDTQISLMVGNIDTFDIDKYLDDVVVRSFGKLYKVNPIIEKK